MRAPLLPETQCAVRPPLLPATKKKVAESVGAAAKLTGSGGAAVVLCPEGKSQEKRLKEACAKEGLECVKAAVGPVNVVAS